MMEWVKEFTACNEREASPYILHAADLILSRARGATALEEHELEAEISKCINDVLESYDAIICPTVVSRGFAAGDDYIDHGIEVGGESLEFYWDSAMTIPFNIMSRCPVLNVPSGFARNGIPTGMQIVGRTSDDATPFKIGAAYEKLKPWFDIANRRPLI
ncbi:amidase family protein [Pseudomonas sp. RIT-PI-q]|uniref:amidase family protein n=1 Tax=Pseudomonas sp. RIT-PI-q TaxID=1690247 RepID=UPI00191C6795|nr:amidase family protein [Pseudomonas sp. RIT-PI-q]